MSTSNEVIDKVVGLLRSSQPELEPKPATIIEDLRLAIVRSGRTNIWIANKSGVHTNVISGINTGKKQRLASRNVTRLAEALGYEVYLQDGKPRLAKATIYGVRLIDDPEANR